MLCQICHLDIQPKGFATHMKMKHHMTTKTYYDIYCIQEDEGICVVCGNATTFKSITYGYSKHCSNKRCSQIDPIIIKKKEQTCISKFGTSNAYQSEEIKEKIRQTLLNRYGVESILQHPNTRQKTYEAINSTKVKNKIYQSKLNHIKEYEIANNCTWKKTLVELYGQGWLKLDIPDIILNRRTKFISNKYIPIIEDYYNHSKSSIYESQIKDLITTIYNGNIVYHSRSIIPHKELDIYIPEYKLAIEFNGIFWHSTFHNSNINYHLEKSLLCREKGIRLIHIYEFEDFEHQLNLLKDLLLGYDNYPKDDFNKNNLIDPIPKSEIIYNDGRLIMYGAGKLKLSK